VTSAARVGDMHSEAWRLAHDRQPIAS